MRGRVGSLLEVGTGFHPELNGRENIYVSGTILGMTRAEVKRHFDEIVGFAEVDQFLDTPVKRYSSGMKVRLGFAVAAHLNPEILVVDEVLAVGDAAFQKKCLGKMSDVALSGRTVLFVSHNMAAMRRLCTRAVLLQAGRLAHIGDTQSTIDKYRRLTDEGLNVPLCDRQDRSGSGPFRFADFQCTVLLSDGDDFKEAPGSPQSGAGARFSMRISGGSVSSARNVNIGVIVTDSLGTPLFSLVSRHQGLVFPDVPSGSLIDCVVESLPLVPATYGVNLVLISNGQIMDRIEHAAQFDVVARDAFRTGRLPDPIKHGCVLVGSQWRLEPVERTVCAVPNFVRGDS